ncbi:MAG: alpha/beta hydrolase [Treponema sp.]|jgi:pimeloyl-ACP methyl ester carboxylesterase|nr:alpha/beta hydrolase [Treponema sp.]
MTGHINNFQNSDHPMESWPPLAEKSRALEYQGGTLFYYDSAGTADSEGSAGILDTGAAKKPSVVLIHGLGDEADSWRHVIAPLNEAGFRVIAPDLPGFGRSAVRGRINMDRHAEAVLALIQAAGAADKENPAVLAGNSMGAVIAEAAAFRRPDLVKALILIDGCFPMAGKTNKSLLIMGLPFIGKKWYRAFRDDPQGAWQSLYGYYHNLDAMPEEDKLFLRKRVIARVESSAQERAYFATLRSLNLVSIFGRAGFSYCVKHFPGKFLVIWGAEDQILKKGKAREICSLRPDAAYTLISGAGHLPQQEKPRETAAVMIDFLRPLL